MAALEGRVGLLFTMVCNKVSLITLLVRDFPARRATGASPRNRDSNAQMANINEVFTPALRPVQEEGSINACPIPEMTRIVYGLLNSVTRANLLGLASGQDLSSQCLEFCRRDLAPAARDRRPPPRSARLTSIARGMIGQTTHQDFRSMVRRALALFSPCPWRAKNPG